MKVKIRFLYIILFLSFFSCNKDVIDVPRITEEKGNAKDEVIVLGDKLDNPYTIKNMTIAYESLAKSNLLKSSDMDKTIEPTHWYIRILPKNQSEIEKIWADSTLELFDYPLDYELLGTGTYHDPEMESGQPGWLYTVVPVGYQMDDMEYELLDECVIPNENDESFKSTDHYNLLVQIEEESLRLTGNLKPSEGLKSISAGVHPSGFIQVKDTSQTTNSYIGVKKIKVRVRSWVKVDSDYTSSSGFYYIYGTRFSSSDIHYDLIFENESGFKIWGNYGSLSPAVYYIGQKDNDGHDRDIGTNTKDWLWATVNNGVVKYRDVLCPTYGITPPPSNLRLWTLRDNNASWYGSAPMARQLSLGVSSLLDFIQAWGLTVNTAFISLTLPDIFIAKNFTTTSETYATLFHELSHASHYTKVGKNYWLSYINGIILNSPTTSGVYGDGNGLFDGFIGVGEMWGFYFEYVCKSHAYGSSSIDGTYLWLKPQILKELVNVYNFTPQQIFSCLNSNVISHEHLKNKLISNYGKETDVKAAFSNNGF